MVFRSNYYNEYEKQTFILLTIRSAAHNTRHLALLAYTSICETWVNIYWRSFRPCRHLPVLHRPFAKWRINCRMPYHVYNRVHPYVRHPASFTTYEPPWSVSLSHCHIATVSCTPIVTVIYRIVTLLIIDKTFRRKAIYRSENYCVTNRHLSQIWACRELAEEPARISLATNELRKKATAPRKIHRMAFPHRLG